MVVQIVRADLEEVGGWALIEPERMENITRSNYE